MAKGIVTGAVSGAAATLVGSAASSVVNKVAKNSKDTIILATGIIGGGASGGVCAAIT